MSSKDDLNVTMLDHRKKMINNAIVEYISHFGNAIDSVGPETSRRKPMKPLRFVSSSLVVTV